jgi:hypothetical protein
VGVGGGDGEGVSDFTSFIYCAGGVTRFVAVAAWPWYRLHCPWRVSAFDFLGFGDIRDGRGSSVAQTGSFEGLHLCFDASYAIDCQQNQTWWLATLSLQRLTFVYLTVAVLKRANTYFSPITLFSSLFQLGDYTHVDLFCSSFGLLAFGLYGMR